MKIKCQYCGKIFDAKRKEQKFCSINCSSKNKNRILKNKCKFCGNVFETNNWGQKYCNDICKLNYKKIHNTKICENCSGEFTSKRKEQRFCSIKCSKQRKNDYYEHTCVHCGKLFETRNMIDQFCRICYSERIKYSQSRGKWCKYKGIKIRSTYELRACNILDKMIELDKIKKWEYEVDKIPYIGIDNSKHKYLIDFKIYLDDINFYYLEVKGRILENDKLKWNEIRNQGYKLDVWFINNIKEQEQKYKIKTNDIINLINSCVLDPTFKIIKQKVLKMSCKNKFYIKRCEFCNKKFISKHNNLKRFCSRSCGNYFVNNTKLIINKCKTCGKDIHTTEKENKEYCNFDCKYPNRNKIYINKCIICGNEFESKTKQKKCCSEKCIIKSYGLNPPKKRIRENRICETCGKEYYPKKDCSRFCSKECRYKK